MPLRGGNEEGGAEEEKHDSQQDIAPNEHVQEDGQKSGETSGDSVAPVGTKAGYRAAFGIVVGSESGATLFNMGLTAAMAALMTISKKHFLDRGNVNPRFLDVFIAILFGCTLLQLPVFLMLAGRDLWRSQIVADLKDFIQGVSQDLGLTKDTRGDTPHSPEEQQRR